MYIHQIQARSARDAVGRWVHETAIEQLARDLELPIGQFKTMLEAPEFSRLPDLQACRCASAAVQGQLLVLHVVETAFPTCRK
jgi:hypothetical protein